VDLRLKKSKFVFSQQKNISKDRLMRSAPPIFRLCLWG